MPSAEWVNPQGPAEEPAVAADRSAAAPLLGTLPQWPFPTLFPPTPERPALATPRPLTEAESVRPPMTDAAPQQRQLWAPGLLEGLPDAQQLLDLPLSSVNPVHLLEDGEPAMHGSVSAAVAGRNLLQSSGAVAPQCAASPALAVDMRLDAQAGPSPLLPVAAPCSELPAVADVGAAASIATLHPAGKTESSKGEELSGWQQAAAGAVASQQRQQQHPSAEAASEQRSSGEQSPGSQLQRPGNREGKREESHDGDGRGGSRNCDRPDGRDRSHESVRERERHDSRGADRERQRDHMSGSDRCDKKREGDDRERRGKHARSSEWHDSGRHDEGRRHSAEHQSRHPGRGERREDCRSGYRDDLRDDYRDDHRDGRRRDSKDRHREAEPRSREGSRQRDRAGEARWRKGYYADGTRAAHKREGEDQNSPEDGWPFDSGRIIPCRCCRAIDTSVQLIHLIFNPPPQLLVG